MLLEIKQTCQNFDRKSFYMVCFKVILRVSTVCFGSEIREKMLLFILD